CSCSLLVFREKYRYSGLHMSDRSHGRANKVVLLINWVLDSFLIVGYIAEYFKGGRSLAFVALFLMIVLVPMLWATILYLRDRHNEKIKYLTLAGYGVMYTLVLFTSSRTIIYVYLFPIVSMYLLYFNLSLIVISCSVITLLNIVRVIYLVAFKGMTDPGITTDYTILLASVILYSISLIVSTRLSNKFNTEKIISIRSEQGKQQEILSDVLKTASVLDRNSHKVYRIVEELAASAGRITDAVAVIDDGASSVASSVREQSELTARIHSVIAETSSRSMTMGNISKETVQAVQCGLAIVNDLNGKTASVNESSDNVYRTMIELSGKSREIEGMTQMITDISDKTDMLSLNASIESARAGNSGRGFAVVADEIRKLATQSRESADSISRIVSELQRKSDLSVEAVMMLKKVNAEQNELIGRTKTVFDTIIRKMNDVDANVVLVHSGISNIISSNGQIVESIGSVSRISDDTIVSTQEARDVTRMNIENANAARALVEELISTSREMEKYMKSESSC
ncbi:MAG: methyl-accepting chemotaxis protein, partial [Spirochaetota bacterium]